MTSKQKEIISDNLKAFIANFGDVRIEKEPYGQGFYVFSPASAESYVQFCYNIHYLNGWLYGCVQAVNKRVVRIDEKK